MPPSVGSAPLQQPTGMRARLRLRRRAAVFVFVATMALYLCTTGGSLTSSDAVVMFDLTRSLVERRSVALSSNLFGLDSSRGADGRYYSPFGLGASLYNIPFYVAGDALQSLVGLKVGKPDTVQKASVATGSAFAAAATVAILFLFVAHATASLRAGLIAAASLAVGSLLWPYSRFGFNAALSALLVVSILYFAWRGVVDTRRRLLVASGALMGFAWLTRHEFVLIAPLVAWWIVRESRRAGTSGPLALASFLPGTLLGGVVWASYNLLRFGSPFEAGHQPTFGAAGFAGLLVSPAASVVLYSPTIVAALACWWAIRDREPRLVRLVVPLTTMMFAFYGSLANWIGGRSYGPRYLVPFLAPLALSIGVVWRDGSARTRRWLTAAVLVGAVVQLPGVFVDYSRTSQSWASQASEALVRDRLWAWEASPLLLNTREAITAVPRNIRFVMGSDLLPDVPRVAGPEERDFAQRLAFSLDFWWLYLFYLGALPRAAAMAAPLCLVALAGGCIVHLRRLTDGR